MKPVKLARDVTGLNKVEGATDVTEDERLATQGNQINKPVQQITQPSPVTPEIVRDAKEARASPRSAAEAERGMRPPSTQGAKSPAAIRGSAGGGGAGFKNNRGFKGATPVDPYSSLSLNVYAKGGAVGKVGQFGMNRSKPDFAGGGGKTNFKNWTKKGDKPW